MNKHKHRLTWATLALAATVRQAVHEVRERGGRIEVCLGDAPAATEPPR